MSDLVVTYPLKMNKQTYAKLAKLAGISQRSRAGVLRWLVDNAKPADVGVQAPPRPAGSLADTSAKIQKI